MGQIKKKTSVKGIVPAEMVSAEMKGQDPSLALYNALSINVKPEDETPEQRDARKMRRQFIFSMFGTSAEELENLLEQNKKIHENQGPSKSDFDILRDSEDVANGQRNSIKNEARLSALGTVKEISGLTGTAAGMVGTTATAISAASSTAAAGTAAVAGTAAAAGTAVTVGSVVATISFVTAGVGLVIGLTALAAGIVIKHKAKKGKKADANEKDRERDKKVEALVKKIEIINEILTQKMDEIMEKKKTLSEKEFAQYKKDLIEEIKQHMKSIGLEVVARQVEDQTSEKVEEEKPEKPEKPKPEKKGKEEKPEKEGEKPEKEGENPEKDENAEERGAE